ncbi:DUF7210 family protein [Rhodanobacter lindaniclasticus]
MFRNGKLSDYDAGTALWMDVWQTQHFITSEASTPMKLILLKDGHTHAGRQCKKGDEIEVSDATAACMADPKWSLIAPLPNSKAAAAAKREV